MDSVGGWNSGHSIAYVIVVGVTCTSRTYIQSRFIKLGPSPSSRAALSSHTSVATHYSSMSGRATSCVGITYSSSSRPASRLWTAWFRSRPSINHRSLYRAASISSASSPTCWSFCVVVMRKQHHRQRWQFELTRFQRLPTTSRIHVADFAYTAASY